MYIDKTITQLQVNDSVWKQTVLRGSWMLKRSGADARAHTNIRRNIYMYFYLRSMSGVRTPRQTNGANDTQRWAFLSIR